MAVKNRFLQAGAGRTNFTDFDQGFWGIDGVPITVSAAQINAAGGTVGIQTKDIWVSNEGMDVVGHGTMDQPYQTITFALSQITDAALIKQYCIRLTCGLYNIVGDLSLKPFVHLNLGNATVTCTGDINLDPAWNFNFTDEVVCFITQGTVNANSIDIDFSTLGFSYNALINWTEARLMNDVFLTGKPTPGKRQVVSFYEFGDINASLSNFTVVDTTIQLGAGNFGTLTYTGTTGEDISSVVNNSIAQGLINITNTGLGFSQLVMIGALPVGGIAINGANAVLVIESGSFISSPSGTHPNNYQLVSISNGINANYTPTNYTPADDSVHGHLVGIDDALDGGGTGFLEKGENLFDLTDNNVAVNNLQLLQGVQGINSINDVVLVNTGGVLPADTYTVAKIIYINNQKAGFQPIGLNMPIMNAISPSGEKSFRVGESILIFNVSTYPDAGPHSVFPNDYLGSGIAPSIQAGTFMLLTLTDNSTPEGSWQWQIYGDVVSFMVSDNNFPTYFGVPVLTNGIKVIGNLASYDSINGALRDSGIPETAIVPDLSATLQTTDGTLTTLVSIPVAAAQGVVIRGAVIGKRVGTTDSISAEFYVGASRAAGNAVQLGSGVLNKDPTSTEDVTFDVDTGTQSVRIRVQGINPETYNWKVTYNYIVVND